MDNEEEFKVENVMNMMMAMVMLVMVAGIAHILPKPKGQLEVVSLELS